MFAYVREDRRSHHSFNLPKIRQFPKCGLSWFLYISFFPLRPPMLATRICFPAAVDMHRSLAWLAARRCPLLGRRELDSGRLRPETA
jgi:hypothetical protein